MTTPQFNENYKPRGIEDRLTRKDEAYRTQGLVYPSDLLSDRTQYGGNYVIFYINVHEDSKLVKANPTGFVDPKVVQQRGAVAELRADQVLAAAAVGGAAYAQGANVAGRVAGAMGVKLTPQAETVGNVTTGVLAAGTAAIVAGGVKKQTKQQVGAIALHIPTDLSIRYSASWDAEGMAGQIAIAEGAAPALAGALVGGGAALALTRNSALAKVAAGAGAAAGAAMSGGAAYAAGLALQVPGGQILGKSAGIAANPKKEQIFREVDFRTFTFSYQFFPRNQKEAQQVRNIIKQFKLHMHPEYKDANGFLYIYPSEFDIVYYQDGTENLNIHRHTSCVLTDMNISYTPQGIVSTFEDGMPSQINVQLTFKELALLTKDNIQDGF